MGGEFTGSIIFIVEHAEPKSRGFSGSWAPMSAVLGLLLGSGIAASLSAVLTPDNLVSWGWRVPFMVSVLGGAVGSYMRRMLSDPQAFKEIKAQQKSRSSPFRDLVRDYKKNLLTIFLIDLTVAIGFYIIVTFVVSYLERFVGFSHGTSLWISTASMLAFAATIPFVGLLIDRVGRKPVLMGTACAFIVFSFVLFKGFLTGSVVTALICHIGFGVLMGFYFAPVAAVLVEAFPAHVRYSGISIAHNLSMAIFGGTAPFVVTWLIQVFDNPMVPAFYLALAACGSLVGLFMMKDRFRDEVI
jgi:MHS family proline/betaine transporter-like MFS transporter